MKNTADFVKETLCPRRVVAVVLSLFFVLLCHSNHVVWGSKPIQFFNQSFHKVQITRNSYKTYEAMVPIAGKTLDLHIESGHKYDITLPVQYRDIRLVTVYNKKAILGHYRVEVETVGGVTLKGYLRRNHFWLVYSEKELSSGWIGAEPEKQKLSDIKFLSFDFEKTKINNQQDSVDYEKDFERLEKKIVELKKQESEGELDPTFLSTYLPQLLKKAKKEYNEGRHLEALDALRRYLRRNSNSAEAFALKGHCHEKLSQHKQRKEAFETAHLIDPGHAGTILALGRYYYQAGRPMLCVDILGSKFDALEEKKDKIESLWFLALSCIEISRFFNANKYASDALKLTNEGRFDFIRGQSLYNLNLPGHKLAAKALRKALQDKNNPKLPHTYYILGIIHLEDGQDLVALDYFMKARKADPKFKKGDLHIRQILAKLSAPKK